MVWDFFEVIKIKIKVDKKIGLHFMLSDWWKSAFKMALEDPQKILLKSTKKHEIVRLL